VETEADRILKVLKCQIQKPGKFYSGAQKARPKKAFLRITMTASEITVIHRRQILSNLILRQGYLQ
jgi:hypothetical protein